MTDKDLTPHGNGYANAISLNNLSVWDLSISNKFKKTPKRLSVTAN